jgi:acetyl esterase/lipase
VRLTPADSDFAFDPCWSADGEFVAWHSWRTPHMSWDVSTWMLAPVDDPTTLIELPVDGFAVQQPRFAPVGSELAYLSDRSGWLNLTVFGPERDAEHPLVAEPFEHGEPAWGMGQRSFAWSPDGAAIAFCRNEAGFGRLCVVDVAAGAVRQVAKAVHGGLHWRGRTLVATRSGGTTPTQLVVYDAGVRGEGSWERTVLAVGPVVGFEPHLAEPESVEWPAPDGAVVHGRLYRPVDADRRAPDGRLIVWIHGGPTSQWGVAFNARFAYWMSRGWSILVPDHRGSTGWGRAYTDAMREGWGAVDVADTAAGARAAVERGWAEPGRVVAMGGSAGGFTVLNLLAHHGDVVAAGVALYAVTDLRALDETTHRFEAHYNRALVGPWPATADRYRDRSPVNHATAIDRPLLLLHGSVDDNVPIAQAEAMVAAMRAAGRPVELHVYEGEGHGWGRPDTVADELARVESFLARVVV